MSRFVILSFVAALSSGCCGAQVTAGGVPGEVSSGHVAGIDPDVARLFAHPYPEGEVPSGFEASPDGRLLAYTLVEGEGDGLRPVLRLVDLESREDRALWDDPALPAGSYEWLPSGEGLLVAAGGDLWIMPVAPEGERVRLTETLEDEEGARISPDGARVAFVRGHDLYVLTIEGRLERRLTTGGTDTLLNGQVDWVHEEELDLSEGFYWSPDGSRIAVLQFDESAVAPYPVVRPAEPSVEVVPQRYPLAGAANPTVRLAVVAVEGEGTAELEWIDVQPEDGYVAQVGWAPGGERISVTTLDRLQRHLQVHILSPEGSERSLLIEERDEAWLNLLDPPHFLGDGDRRFLWRSERSGHAHLYVHDGDGEPRALTSGEWQVSEVVSVDEEGEGTVYFIGNREGPSSYQLYSVPLAGGEVTRLSTEEGCHSVTFAPDHARYVVVHSSLNRPPRAEVRLASGELAFALAESSRGSIPYEGQAVGELLRVPGGEGREYEARMIRPAELEPGRRYPVLVWVYNGPGAQIVRNQWRTKYIPWMRHLASEGVIVFSMDGRGTHGRGRQWEKALYRQLGEVELADQMEGVEYLRGLDYVDADRIGAFGWSYGGTMVLTFLLRQPGTFRMGVSVAPVTDWHLYDSIYTERYMTRPVDNPDGYRDSALMQHATALEDPLLLIHGLSDDNVHFDNSSRMIDALVQAGRRFDVMLYPGQSHGISAPHARPHVFATISAYVLEHLLP